MVTIYDVDPSELINRAAGELKKIEQIKAPEWALFVKTGTSRERPPVDKDWWYVRAASILRKVSILGPIGVNKLRKKYGGMKNRGHKPGKFYVGSGNIIRKILQQLEKAELIKFVEKKSHKGKVITPKGIKFLNQIANGIGGTKKDVPEKEPLSKKDVHEKKEEKVEKEKKLSPKESLLKEVREKEKNEQKQTEGKEK